MYSIIGSGIAGLACSYTLSNFDIDNEIFESSDSGSENGYGIQLSPNASNVLEKLGILEKLEAKMKVINRIEIYSAADLKKLTTLPVNEFIQKNNLTKYYTASRDILHAELLSSVISRDTKINYGSKIVRVEDHDGKIKITKKNERIKNCDKLIIANGNSGSQIFEKISNTPKSNNFITHRSTAKLNKFPLKISEDTVYLFLGKGMHVVVYPYFEDLINIVMITKKTQDTLVPEKSLNTEKSIATFLSDSEWHSWNLYDSQIKLNLDNSRPIFAIGDAAHSIKPHLAQGASMALEDAYILGKLISKKSIIESVHHSMNLRQRRINKVIRSSSLNRQIFHAPPIVSIFRDTFLKRIGGLRQLDNLKWLYGYKV